MGFHTIWLLVLVVKSRCSIFHSKRHILSIRSPFLDFFISLESSFFALSIDASCYSRFYSKHILFNLLHFSILVDILIVSSMRIDFVGSDASFLESTIYCINLMPFLIFLIFIVHVKSWCLIFPFLFSHAWKLRLSSNW